MIRQDDIKDILNTAKSDWREVSRKDVIFCILCDTITDKNVAYQAAYGKVTSNADDFYNNPRMVKLLELLRPFGIGQLDESFLSREQNKTELLALLTKIKAAAKNNEIDTKDALKMEADIRVKLNDKFDMDEGHGQKHIIIVPQKHDLICPHTNRECTFMPTKEACMKYYKLKDTAHE